MWQRRETAENLIPGLRAPEEIPIPKPRVSSNKRLGSDGPCGWIEQFRRARKMEQESLTHSIDAPHPFEHRRNLSDRGFSTCPSSCEQLQREQSRLWRLLASVKV